MIKEQSKKETGISLLALIITIIVLIILASVTYNLTLGQNGIITKAYEAKYLTELAQYKEELELFKAEKLLENNNFEGESLTSAYNSLIYNTQPEGETGTIYDVIKSLEGGTFDGKMEIIKGELLLNSQDMTEIRMAQKLDIQVNPYLIVDGVLLSANTNLALMDENGSLTIPESVRAIGEGAFADLTGLRTIVIPGTVKEIRQNAFRNNRDLENVILMEGIEKIGVSAFQGCGKIINVQLPESLTEISQGAFQECSSLEKIKIPSKIETISAYTFYYCTSLQSVEFPENLKVLYSYSFRDCSKLDNIYIPKSVTNIETSVFANCSNLSNIEIDEENLYFRYDANSGILMTTDGSRVLFISDKVIKASNIFSIPEGVINFEVTLSQYTNITELVIPESLESIETANYFPTTIVNIEIDSNNQHFTVENDCLYNKDKTELKMCFSKDTTVELADSVKNLANYSFRQAINLEEIHLPDSLTEIGTQVFYYNKSLKEIYIGPNVNKIEPLFKYGNYSGTVVIDEDNQNYTIENNVLYNKDKTEIITILFEINGKFVVNSNVTSIGRYAFHGQSKMTEVELPEGLIKIDQSFNYCDGLISIYIPNSVEAISQMAFASMDNLQQIQIDKEQGSISGSPWGAIRGDRIVEWLR